MELIWISMGIFLALWIERKMYQPRNLKSFSYQLEMERSRVIEGDSLVFTETITNKSLLPFPEICTEIEIIGDLELTSEDRFMFNGRLQCVSRKSSLKWLEKVIRVYPVHAHRRGVHQVRLMGYHYTDALQTDHHSLHLLSQTELIVYPKIYDMEEILSLPLNLFGDYFVRRWIHEDVFFPSGIRDYLPGDNLRFVDWKKSARHQSLKTRTYDYTNSNQLIIILNLQTSSSSIAGSKLELVEDVIRVAASVVHATAQEGFVIGMLANGGCVGYAGQTLALSPDQYQDVDQLYECLARLVNFQTQPLDRFLQSQMNLFDQQANILLITGYMNEEIRSCLLKMQDRVRSMKLITLGEIEEKLLAGLPTVSGALKGVKQYAKNHLA